MIFNRYNSSSLTLVVAFTTYLNKTESHVHSQRSQHLKDVRKLLRLFPLTLAYGKDHLCNTHILVVSNASCYITYSTLLLLTLSESLLNDKIKMSIQMKQLAFP